jgi:hypothetical protein
MVDNLAKSYWNHLCSEKHEPQSQRFGDEGWALHINNKKVSKFGKNRIYQSLYNEKVIEYWAKKAQRHREAMRSVDWAICGAAFKKLPIPKQRRVTKHCSGHMACGRMMKLWKFQDHEECPRCPEQRETPLHVLECPAPSTTMTWERSVTKLQVWMELTHTMPELQTAIVTRLRQWKGTIRGNPVWTAKFGLREAVMYQDELGWYNFLMGRISIQWKEVQHRYYQWLGKRNTGRKWATALIKKVWEVSWDMWDHRNKVRLNTVTPAQIRRNEALDALIHDEYLRGTTGMTPRDHHWLSHAKERILEYPYERKEQWGESIQLARIRFGNRDEHEAASNRQQRVLIGTWIASNTA